MMDKLRKLTHFEISKNRVSREKVHDAERAPIYVVLDNIRSMYNVGSIFRSSDGAFIRKLYLTGFTPTPDKNEVKKTALGAVDSIPWEYVKNPLPVLKSFKEQNITICTLEHTTKSIPYFDLTPDFFPVCLVIGNELTGVSEKIIEHTDVSIEIPMFGTKQSLNVAVAYGIVLFDMLRILGSTDVKRFSKFIKEKE